VSALVLGKPARHLFSDEESAAALEASWRDNKLFCSRISAPGSELLLSSFPVPVPGKVGLCLWPPVVTVLVL
jgi:hypothetical protein